MVYASIECFTCRNSACTPMNVSYHMQVAILYKKIVEFCSHCEGTHILTCVLISSPLKSWSSVFVLVYNLLNTVTTYSVL